MVATAGTTLTGAVDPVGAIAEVVDGSGAWLHVDGAYGVPAACTELVGHLFAGLDRADSVSVDAHKWLFVPKACGILLVRDPGPLRTAFRHDASYMVEDEGNAYPVDSTMEYSRPFRALKLWTALRAHGAQAFRDAITTTIELARELAQAVRERPGLELLVDEPELSTVPFRRIPAHGDVDEHNLRLAGRCRRTAGRSSPARWSTAGLPAAVHRQLPHHPRRRAVPRRPRRRAGLPARVPTLTRHRVDVVRAARPLPARRST